MAVKNDACVFCCFDVDDFELRSYATGKFIVSQLDEAGWGVWEFEHFEGLVSESVVFVTLEIHAH